MNLSEVPPGDSVLILGISGADAIARRLEELGLREGIRVEVLRRSPFGDPTVYGLCGYQLCLRKTESARVEVKAANTQTGHTQAGNTQAANARTDDAETAESGRLQ